MPALRGFLLNKKNLQNNKRRPFLTLKSLQKAACDLKHHTEIRVYNTNILADFSAHIPKTWLNFCRPSQKWLISWDCLLKQIVFPLFTWRILYKLQYLFCNDYVCLVQINYYKTRYVVQHLWEQYINLQKYRLIRLLGSGTDDYAWK